MALETVTRGDSYNHRCIAMTSGKICGRDSLTCGCKRMDVKDVHGKHVGHDLDYTGGPNLLYILLSVQAL